MRKIACILLILPIWWQCTDRKTIKEETIYNGYATLELQLEGKQYDSLTVFARYKKHKDDKGIQFYKATGSTEDGYNWTFLIPDSLRKHKVGCFIKTKSFDFEKNEDYVLTFSTPEVSHRTSLWSIPLDEKETIVKAKYEKIKEFKLDYDWEYDLLPDTTVSNPTIINDLFYLKIKEKYRYTDWELEFVYPRYGLMPEDDAEYEEKMKEYIALAEKYPESLSLIESIGPGMGFRTKKDIKRVYNIFSKETRKRHEEYSPHIKDYLDYPTKHVDIRKLSLVNYKTGEREQVVLDKTKPTLILFSCIGWERNEDNTITIEALKEIYKEKTPSLDIVIINEDPDNTDKWRKLIIEKQTPWRNLQANKEELHALIDTYQYWEVSSVILIDKEDVKVLHVYNIDKLKNIINNY